MNCHNCIHFNWEQSAKMFGHPCNIHGGCDVYECKDYEEKRKIKTVESNGNVAQTR